MKLISEINEEVRYLTEASETGKKFHYLEGVFMEADCANRNGRRYSNDILKKEVTRFNEEVIKQNRGFGELGHPSGPTINLDRVSHMITSIKENGSQYIGRARIAETPMGGIVRGLLETGARLGVSSRALGSLKEGKDGIMEVQSDLRLITVDVVADPSAPNAFVEGIMEGAEWFFNESTAQWIQEKADKLKNTIKKMTSTEIEEKRVKMFGSFINELASRKS